MDRDVTGQSRTAGKLVGRVAVGLTSDAVDALVQIVFPATCRLCSRPVEPSADFCRACQTALDSSANLMKSACPNCGRPRPGVSENLENSENRGSDNCEDCVIVRCPQCRETSYEFDGVYALWTYRDRVCQAVVAAKFARHAPLGDALGRRLGQRVLPQIAFDPPDLLTFVPAHITRQFSRGGVGNRAIAMGVANVLGYRVCDLLRVTRRIRKQAWLTEDERTENVRGAFSLKRSYALFGRARLRGMHVLVVDDVLTTGATANEISRVLLGAGARRVSLAVVARALRTQ